MKAQEFQREIAGTMARVPQVIENIKALRELWSDSVGAAGTGQDATLTVAVLKPDGNTALEAWRRAVA